MKKLFLVLTLSAFIFSFSPERNTNESKLPTNEEITAVSFNLSTPEEGPESCKYIFNITWTGAAASGQFGHQIVRDVILNQMIQFGLITRTIHGPDTETWRFRVPCDGPIDRADLETAIRTDPDVDMETDDSGSSGD